MSLRCSKYSHFPWRTKILAIGLALTVTYHVGFWGILYSTAIASATAEGTNNKVPAEATIELTEGQLSGVKIESAIIRSFRVEKEVIGSVAYKEKAGITPKSTGTKFAVANVPESDSPLIQVGQPVAVRPLAYPERTFDGKVSTLGVTAYDTGGNPALDPNTHRITVRCEIADPENELYPGMLASIVIQVQNPVESIAIPQNGISREGDGTMTVWVTSDRKHFERRTVKVGLHQDGYDQILEGITPGELIATDGALFIDNALTTTPE